MNPDAYIKLYPTDFFSAIDPYPDSVGLGYLRAICYYVKETHVEGIDDVDDELRRICRCESAVWARTKGIIFGRFFKLEAGKWHQKRAREEYLSAQDSYRRMLQGSKAGVQARRNPPLNPPSNPGLNPPPNSPPTYPQSESESESESEVQSKAQPERKPSGARAEAGIETLKEAVGSLYNRPNGKWTYAEECLLTEIWRNNGAWDEFKELCEYRDKLPKEERKWFPRSVTGLLEKWYATLDKARGGAGPGAGPSHEDLVAFATEKVGENPKVETWAYSFAAYWSKRKWERNGQPIDWREELSEQIAKWREEKVTA